MQKFISVIIPCYNVENYVARCLDSVINQTYKNLEIICVNDGSTDNTLAILKDYAKKDSRIKIIDKKNGGLSSARNAGIEVASYEYVVFLDSDDWIEPNTYELAISKMDDDIDLVRWNVRLVNYDDIWYVCSTREWYNLFDMQGKISFNQEVLRNFTIEVWNKIFRKSIIDKHHIRFPEGLLHEDWVFFWHYALFMRNVYCIPDKLYNYYQRKGSIVNNVLTRKLAHNFDKLQICDRVYENFVKEGVFEEYKTAFIESVFLKLFPQMVNEVYSVKEACLEAKKYICKWGIQFEDYHLMYLLMNDCFKEIEDIYVKSIYVKQFNNKKREQKISIIVPVYNREKYLKRCLNSLMNQTYKNIEIICIDDCSTDNSCRILSDASGFDWRIKVYQNDEHRGIGYTRQMGLELSSCDYIMWCDSDDWYEPTMCEKMLKAMLKYNVDMVECSVQYVDSPDIGIRKEFELDFAYHVCRKGKQSIDFYIFSNMYKFFWNKLYRRSIIEDWKIKVFSLPVYEDMAFVYLYLMRSKSVYFIDEKLYNYYRHGGSVSSCLYDENKGVVLLDEFKAFEKVVDFVKEHNWKDKFYICNEMYYKYLFSLLDIGKFIVNNHTNKLLRLASKVVSDSSKYCSVKMNIFFACDNNYIEQLYVAMYSILVNSLPNDIYNFYILDGGISWLNKQKLNKLKKVKPFTIEYIKMNDKLFSNFPITDLCNYISRTTYYRYMIPRLKPELDKCLYLDCDLILEAPIRKLYSIDIEDNYVAAVQDASRCTHSFYKQFDIDVPFNAGVLLINNKKWKEDNIVETLFENTSKLKDVLVWQDQDVLNYTFKGKVKFIDWNFNLQQSFFTENVEPYKYTFDEVQKFKFNHIVIHYAGPIKPWQAGCVHPFWWRYYSYLKQTPFKKNAKKYLKKILKEL